jgi:hypothetical protein
LSQTVTAEQFQFVHEGVWPQGLDAGSRELIDLWYDGQPIDLLADSERRWHIGVFMQSPPELKLTMRWVENGEPQQVSQPSAS